MAVSFRHVRPKVSRKVLWVDISSVTIEIGDRYFTFLSNVSMLAHLDNSTFGPKDRNRKQIWSLTLRLREE